MFHNNESSPELDKLIADIYEQGFGVADKLVPQTLLTALAEEAKSMSKDQYSQAGIGRRQGFTIAPTVRSDKTKWIARDDALGQEWNTWLDNLQQQLNRALMLGLFSHESHYAWYQAGDFYSTHRDAFVGQSNRRLSLVLYLNENWQAADKGELIIYSDSGERELMRVTPTLGKLALFLSEDFPHEVVPATRDRYSIAAWFRVNA